MKIYVAASSREMTRAIAAMEWIRSEPGMEVAHDWVTQIKEVGIANPSDVPEGLRRSWSMATLEALRDSRAIWLLLPEEPTAGAWFELGAMAAFNYTHGNKKIFTSGTDSARYRSIFTSLAREHFREDALVIPRLRIFAG